VVAHARGARRLGPGRVGTGDPGAEGTVFPTQRQHRGAGSVQPSLAAQAARVRRGSHEVSVMAGGAWAGGKVSTTRMRPRWHTGHSRREHPVSCS